MESKYPRLSRNVVYIITMSTMLLDRHICRHVFVIKFRNLLIHTPCIGGVSIERVFIKSVQFTIMSFLETHSAKFKQGISLSKASQIHLY